MRHHRTIRVFWLIALLLCCAPLAMGQGWQDSRYHLSMTGPTGWVPMNEALLASANSGVSHVTGRGFIAGYALRETDILVFPYLLVQFKPYAALPAQSRPVAKLDERGKLELICSVVDAFGHRGPLPQTIDTPQFIDRYGKDIARLVRLDDDGRFDVAGKIPHEVEQDAIRYHTHGVIGKDGVALATIFTIDPISDLATVIAGDMRTLAFDQDFSYAALPDEAPQPENETSAETTPERNATPDTPATNEPATTQTNPQTPANPAHVDAPLPANSDALVLILALLATAFVATTLIVWFVIHQKAKARRERERARRERLHAAQASTHTPASPRMAAPPKAPSRVRADQPQQPTTKS